MVIAAIGGWKIREHAGLFEAIIAGLDLGYVVVHHLTRVIFVILGAPLFAKVLAKPLGQERAEGSE